MNFQSKLNEIGIFKHVLKNFKLFLMFGLLFFSLNIYAEDFYNILGLNKSASQSEIKSAYRKQAQKLHPDRNLNNPNADAIMAKLNKAYEVLSDPMARSTYDRYGTYKTSSAEDTTKSRVQMDIEYADSVGPMYSNAKWTYESASHRFYDNRTRKWLFVKNNYFRSEEGWLFYPEDGTYFNTDLRANWNPENNIGWYRRTSNLSDKIIPINFINGFSQNAIYEPGTVSDSSHLFDELMNPVNLLNFKNNIGNRNDLMKEFDKLIWTESQVKDFIGRAKAHITILAIPEMKTFFTGDSWYFNAAMEAVLDYEIVRQNPEIVVDFIRRSQDQYKEEISKQLFMKEDWLTHRNSSIWLSELFSYSRGRKAYLDAVFFGDRSNLVTKLTKFKSAYLVMEKVGMDSITVDHLLGCLGYLGVDAYNIFADELKALTYHKSFLELIATIDPNATRNIQMFLDWYKLQDSKRALIFVQALNMEGAKRDDYWKISPDHTQYNFAESEYNDHKLKTSDARMQFLNINLPKNNLVLSPSNFEVQICKSLFRD